MGRRVAQATIRSQSNGPWDHTLGTATGPAAGQLGGGVGHLLSAIRSLNLARDSGGAVHDRSDALNRTRKEMPLRASRLRGFFLPILAAFLLMALSLGTWHLALGTWHWALGTPHFATCYLLLCPRRTGFSDAAFGSFPFFRKQVSIARTDHDRCRSEP